MTTICIPKVTSILLLCAILGASANIHGHGRGIANLSLRNDNGINRSNNSKKGIAFVNKIHSGGSAITTDGEVVEGEQEAEVEVDASVTQDETEQVQVVDVVEDDETPVAAASEGEEPVEEIETPADENAVADADTGADVTADANVDIEEPVEPEEEASSSSPITTTTTTTKEEAASGMASPPLRISTSQMGNSIAIHDVTKAQSKRALMRKERKEMRKQKKLARKEEKSHRVYAKKLKNRNNLNIGRKVLHAGFGFVFATLNQVIPRKFFLPGMITLTTGTLVMECLRYRKNFGWMNDCLNFVLGGTLRKHEMEGKFTGSFYYFLGVTITAYCFPTSCASLGICQLALADPSASYFGRKTKNVYWSRIENGCFGIGRNKGILGFLGGAAVCFPFNFYTLSIAKIAAASELVSPGSIAAASLVLGLAGAFADLCVPSPALTMPKKICGVPMPQLHVDDNVVVPIFSGYACTKIFDYLGWGAAGVDLAKLIVF